MIGGMSGIDKNVLPFSLAIGNRAKLRGLNLVGIDSSDPNGLDDIVVQELHLPKGREVIFKFRSQDVLHSAFMPHFRAQMNCVPGMITEFAFTPNLTTEEMRQTPEMTAKVNKINKIRYDKSQKLIANGEQPLDAYQFDYLLLFHHDHAKYKDLRQHHT